MVIVLISVDITAKVLVCLIIESIPRTYLIFRCAQGRHLVKYFAHNINLFIYSEALHTLELLASGLIA